MNHLIKEQSQLQELEPLFAQLHTQSGHIAVDTEFLREKTYNAKLCLVQLGIGEHQYCIDVLSVSDLTVLANLFADQKVLKIFHAARQDIEVLYQSLGVIPRPIFDTQLAAAFCGMNMQIGYSALVQARLEIELPKSQARTDWTRRPLSPEQLAYAADDVAYLEHLYLQSLNDLTEQGKLDWFQQEIQSCYEVGRYVIDPANAYHRLSGSGLKIEQQYTLKALAEWRETIAQKRDLPRSWVLKDDQMFELATRRPLTKEAVKELGVFGKKSVDRSAPTVAKIISQVEIGDQFLWNPSEPLDKQDKGICKAMMKELSKYADQHSVAQGLLGTRKDVEALYRHRQSTKLLGGWRESVVGQPLLDFAESKAA